MSLSKFGSTNMEHQTIYNTETVDVVTKRIEQAGMTGPVAVLLHTLKPLAWVGGQLAWMLQPFVDGLSISKRSPLSISGLANLLESEDGVDRLLEKLHEQTMDDGRLTTEIQNPKLALEHSEGSKIRNP
jgi:hypothetical protein